MAKVEEVIADTQIDTTPIPEGVVEDNIDTACVAALNKVLFGKAKPAAKDEPKASKCEALRTVARDYKGERKAFVASAVSIGINKATASTQWQKGRA